MLITFKAQTNIDVNQQEAWKMVSSSRFVGDFLPEIYKNIMGMSLYALASHKNGIKVMPAYVIRNQTIHWNRASNTGIELARTDLKVLIDHIEINLDSKNDQTTISIEIEYDNPLGHHFFLANKAVKAHFNHKLLILKRDLEAKQTTDNSTPVSYGYPVF